MRKVNFLETFRRWLKPGKKSAPAVLKPVRPPVPPRPARSHEIEPLETRIAPAILVNPMTVMYQDADGDNVTVKSSKAIFTNANLNSVFTFDTGPVGGTATPQQLQTLDLNAALNGLVSASGANITISATQAGAGNGAVDVGYIHAVAISLGAVSIEGDLGRIDAGGTSAIGVKSLSVQSLGTRGLTTQSAVTPSLVSNITGGLGSLLASGDVKDVTFNVFDGGALFPGKIGSLTIKGSLLGGTADDTGVIFAEGDIGPVKIGVNLSGGDGMNSGQISAGKISGLTISGSMIGGKGVASGSVEATGAIGAIKIGGAIQGADGNNSAEIRSGGKIASVDVGAALPLNTSTAISGGKGASSGLILSTDTMGAVKIHGDIEGGDGANSGEIFSSGKLASVTISGKFANNQFMGLIGGKGLDSGTVVSFSDIGLVKITGDILGGDGEQSGQINASGKLAGVTVTNGSVVGGLGLRSGAISSVGSMGTVNIAKDLHGSAGNLSGSILASESLLSAILGGSLIGGSVDESGEILVSGNIGSVKILGDVTGTAMLDTGSIFAGGKIGTVTIGGKLTGGAGDNSGSVFSGTDWSIPGDFTRITVSGEVAGGGGANSGQINSGGNIGSATLNKSLTGGAGNFSGVISAAKTITTVTVKNDVHGAGGANSGQINGNKIKTATISGSLVGGSGENSGAVLSQTIFGPEQDIQGDIGRVTVNGIDGVKGSTGAGSGQINSAGVLTSVTVAHSLTGGSGNKSGSILSGTDPITSGLMSAVTIKGDIQGGSIRSGDAIGSIVVKGNVGAEATPVVISARGQAVQGATTDLAIKSVSVGGSVAFTNILAGYDTNLVPLNVDAQIGSVKVTHDWTASSIAAGIIDAAHDGFGNATNARISGPDNAAIVSKIASVVIGGNVAGTAAAGDHFGFVAQQIGSLKYPGTTAALTANVAPDVIDPINPATPDTSIREFAV